MIKPTSKQCERYEIAYRSAISKINNKVRSFFEANTFRDGIKSALIEMAKAEGLNPEDVIPRVGDEKIEVDSHL